MDSDDWIVLGLAIGGLIALAQMSRSQSAAAAVASGGGLSFPPAAPTTGADIVGSILPMSVSPAGIAAIQQREGFTATPVSDGAKQEIGYGHDILPGEQFSVITEPQGTELLVSDLTKVATDINNQVSVPLTQNQFDALASFVYNIGDGGEWRGGGAFSKSTLLRLLNNGNYAGAAQQFARWNQSGGAINAGLVARRQGEAAQFAG